VRANTVTLAAQPRSHFGKRTGRLRRSGWTPANVYGAGAPSVAIQVATREAARLLTHTGRNTLISLAVEGSDEVTVLVRGVDRRPTNDELYHIDFFRVSMTETLKSTVPLVLVGDAPAVAMHEATILRALDSITVECLPSNLPGVIEVDIEQLLDIGDAIHVADLKLPTGVTALDDPDSLVVHAVAPQRMTADEEEEEAAAEAAAEAEAEAPEGEAEAEGEEGAEASTDGEEEKKD
jgi:large subunit ribosomal protein L25